MKDYKDADIVVSISGGLGNKLHSLYSCHALTLNHDIPMKYYWHDDQGSGCMFEHLFNCPAITLADGDQLNDRISLSGDTLTPSHLSQRIHWHSPYLARLETSTEVPCLVQAFRDILPSKRVLERLESVDIPPNAIGIHVRGGDIKAGNMDPLDHRQYVGPERFFMLDPIVRNHPGQPLFISCENLEDETVLCGRYQHLMKLEPCVHNRNTIEGVIDAFVNIILLSRCKTIIGMNSSFSTIACRIGGAGKIDLR